MKPSGKIGEEAIKDMADALNFISRAVRSTLGPGGRPFVYDKADITGRNSATFSKDGLTVLRSLGFVDNPASEAVLAFCRQAASHSVLASGDGPQPLYSKVLTPLGFVDMGDVQVGMELCGTKGTIQTVLGVFPKGEKEIYKIEFSNGRVVECCGDHLWHVTNVGTLHNTQQIKTTTELQKDYIINKPCSSSQKRYYTPKSCVEFYDNSAEMPLDPYLVGLLLGDGSLSGTGSIELSLGVKKEHVIDKIILPNGLYLHTTYVADKNSFRVKIQGKNEQGKSIVDIVRSIGLLGSTSLTKFIPKSYLYTTINQRKQLLQGLMDTDGHISKRGLFEFSSVSERLFKDVVDLCRSLGISIYSRKHERKENDGSYSMVPIYKITQLKGYKFGDRIDKITATGNTTTMQCIKVSNSDNLYITDDYITTHNTTSTIVLAAEIANQVLKSNHKWPQSFARQIEKEAQRAIAAIRSESVRSDAVVRQVALTSTNGDEELTDIVIDAISKSSAFGAILCEKNPALRERYRTTTQDGYSHCMGYDYNNTLALSASPAAAANDAIVWEKPLVAIFNGNLLLEKQLDPIISAWNEFLKNDDMRNLVIVAYETSDEIANKLLVINRTLANNGVAAFIVKPRLSAEFNSGLQALRDIAAFCGVQESKIIDGGNYKFVTTDYFGTCDKIKISTNNTVFIGRSINHWVDLRIQQNVNISNDARSYADKELTIKRNAQLTEGLVKVEVGCGLLPDLQERADRFDDASKAAQACMRNGALPGCGFSLIRAAQLINASEALKNAFSTIHENIMNNFGLESVADRSDKGLTVRLCEDANGSTTCDIGDASILGIYDATDTVCAVIKNGVDLGVKIAILGGYSLRNGIGRVTED